MFRNPLVPVFGTRCGDGSSCEAGGCCNPQGSDSKGPWVTGVFTDHSDWAPQCTMLVWGYRDTDMCCAVQLVLLEILQQAEEWFRGTKALQTQTYILLL